MDVHISTSNDASKQFVYLNKVNNRIYNLSVSANMLSYDNINVMKKDIIKVFIDELSKIRKNYKIAFIIEKKITKPLNKVDNYKRIWKSIQVDYDLIGKTHDEIQFIFNDGFKYIGYLEVDLKNIEYILHLLSTYYLNSFVIIYNHLDFETLLTTEVLYGEKNNNSIHCLFDYNEIYKFISNNDNEFIIWNSSGEEEELSYFSNY